MKCLVAIPTYNRSQQVYRAAVAALEQHCNDVTVAVIDDGSTDDTESALTSLFPNPRFAYLRLARNVGTAKAKNVALALLPFDAITFHDSDDIPHPTKVLRQRQILELSGVEAHPCLNWALAARQPGSRIDVGVALTQHTLITGSGARFDVTRALSLVDDFFPQLQMNAGPPGDWILINSGLFRRSVFSRVGGFADCIEEDRELRNRLIMAGEVLWLIDDVLLTKVDSPDSLTNQQSTGYASTRREQHRRAVWAKVSDWLATGKFPVEMINLSDVAIASRSPHAHPRLADDLPIDRGSLGALHDLIPAAPIELVA
jgi:glycosyltransferase involved in cell wall biosynthesis